MAIYFDDTFTGADDTLITSRAPDVGTSWLLVSSGGASDTVVIKSNAAVPNDARRWMRTGGFSGTPGDDLEAIFEGVRKTTNDIYNSGPIVRAVYDTPLGYLNGGYALLFEDVDGSNSKVQLYRVGTNNSLTAIGSAYQFTRPGSDATVNLKVQASGSSIKGLLDTGSGYVERCTATDSTFTTAGIGAFTIGAPFPGYTGLRCSRFVVQDISAGGSSITLSMIERNSITRGLNRGVS